MEYFYKPIKDCNVRFTEENKLIDQIININKNLPNEEIRPFYNLKKNLNTIEKNTAIFNTVIDKLWLFIWSFSIFQQDKLGGNQEEVLNFILQHSEFHKKQLKEVESQLSKSFNLNILNTFSFFQENSIKDACNEVIIALENVYSSAWRVKTSIKELKNFKPKGITYLRNHLLEHPSEEFNWVLSSFNFSIDDGPLITYVQVPKFGKNLNEDKIDIDIERDLIEFKKALFQRLTSILDNLTS